MWFTSNYRTIYSFMGILRNFSLVLNCVTALFTVLNDLRVTADLDDSAILILLDLTAGRSFSVQFSQLSSSKAALEGGVPQGSILFCLLWGQFLESIFCLFIVLWMMHRSVFH
ncbi:hypothetical protein ILYODFUR_007649 [Ilyodon furcidens]|uniref:Reverse transcriptase n=1 Tax=Ilyodon furcidens TaxID=33524 RepID=A0ABV0T766_9TELE